MILKRFSLVELLVVVAIASFFITLIAPVLASMKRKAGATECVYGLKNLGAAFQMYSAHYRGVLPHEDGGSGGEDPIGCCWYDRLPEYLSRGSAEITAVTLCQDRNVSDDEFYNSDSQTYYSYKMNSRLEDYRGSPAFRQLRTIGEPARTLLLFDGRLDDRYYQYRPYGLYSSVYQRHDERAGMLFIDGGVTMRQNSNSIANHWLDYGDLIWDPDRELR